MKKNQLNLSSFEELAKSQAAANMGFDYKKAQSQKEIDDYKKSYNAATEYENLKIKIRAIDDKRNNFYRWKSYYDFLSDVLSLPALKKKIERTFKELADKGNNLSFKEEQLHNAACYFNNFDNIHYDTIKEVSNEIKVAMIACEQSLKETISEKNIKEYSNALKIIKKLEKARIDDEIQSFSGLMSVITSKEEYHYLRMTMKLQDYFEHSYYCKNDKFPDPKDFVNWLKRMVKKYEKED